MNKSKLMMATLAILFMSQSMQAAEARIVVTNDEKVQRQEVVEVDIYALYKVLGINSGESFVIRNALGQEVLYQVTYDGKLLLDVSVRPCGSAAFTVTKGQPSTMKTYVTGKQYPERVDDIAWENDRTAYRIYGPALQRSGEKAFGVDVWVKNTPDLEVDKRYATELNNHHKIQDLKSAGKDEEALAVEMETTYHYDHGYGLDCYKVGPTLGGGAPALMEGGKLILPYCYKDYEILDNGPLRFTVKVSYHPTHVNSDDSVIENRIISLDKGSNFNKCVVWYDGLTKVTDLAMGVVLHQEDLETVLLGKDMVLYADPTDNPAKQNFQIYVGCLFPNGVTTTKKLMNEEVVNGNAGHAVGIAQIKSGEQYVYYFGSAWSKNDVRTFNEWKLRAEETLNAIHAPLHTAVE